MATCTDDGFSQWAEKIQRDFNVNSLQVLLYQAPISAMLMAIAWPWIEQVNTLLEYSTDNLISFWVSP